MFNLGSEHATLTLLQAGFLFLTACVGGMLTAIAAGGGLIIFPSLLATGLPAVNARATSAFAAFPGYVATLTAYRDKLETQQKLAWLLGVVSLVGGLLGGLLLLYIPASTFDRFVPYLMLIASLLFTFSKAVETKLQPTSESEEQTSWSFWLKTLLTQFVISVHGGFSGLGTGFLMLVTLTLVGIEDVHQVNALKVAMMLCIDSLAVVAFLVAGEIAWQHAALIMAGTTIGGYSSAYYAKQLNPKYVRYFVGAIAWAVTCYLLLQSFKA